MFLCKANLEILSSLQLGVVKFVRVLVTVKPYVYNGFLKSRKNFSHDTN